jgi:hypothetical protein
MLALILPSALFALPDGYHSFKVSHKRPFYISLTDRMLFFAFDEYPHPGVNFTVIDSKNQTSPIPMTSFTHIQFFQTSVHVSTAKGHPYVLHYWLLSPRICSSVSYSALADHSISFRLSSDRLTSDFCLFSQSGASSYDIKLDLESHSPHARAELWTTARGPDKKCRSEGCNWKSKRPFFLRVLNASDAEFSSALTLSVFRSGFQSLECSLKSVPIMVGPTVQIPMGFLAMTDIKCVSMAVYLLRVIGFTVGTIIIAVTLLGLLQAIGFINIRTFFGCGAEAERFNALKEDPYAHELE